MLAFLHGVHGSCPSHRTLRLRQQSHALFSGCFGALPPLLPFFSGGDAVGATCAGCVSEAISTNHAARRSPTKPTRSFSLVALVCHASVRLEQSRMCSHAMMALEGIVDRVSVKSASAEAKVLSDDSQERPQGDGVKRIHLGRR